MKLSGKIILCIAVPLLTALSCSVEQDEPEAILAPEVRVGAGFADTGIKLGESLTFEVELLKGSRVSICWWVDDVLEGTGTSFTYRFRKSGDHIVRFRASNGSGEVAEECKISVSNELEISFTYDDGQEIELYVYSKFNCIATVETEGIDVSHNWFVDGSPVCTQAWLKDFPLDEVRTYSIRYEGTSSIGSVTKEFTVNAVRIPLEVSFSVPAGELKWQRRKTLTIVATPLYDGVVASQSWKIGGKLYSSEKDLSFSTEKEGLYTIDYEAVNPDGFVFKASWDVYITAPQRVTALLTDFENATSLPGCFLTSGATVLNVIDNPCADSANPSAKCMLCQVDSEGSTSGYFTFSYSGAAAMVDNISSYTGIRFKINLGKNLYLPLIEYQGRKYAPVENPTYDGGWQTLEYDFGSSIKTYATFRPMLDMNGNNVGKRTETNNKIVYFDDVELF